MTIIVAGGTRGIGRAIVERCVKDGDEVIFTYRSSRKEAEQIQEATDGKATGVQTDGTNPEDVAGFFASAVQPRSLRGIVVSQGANEDRLVKDLTWNDFTGLFTQNVAPAVNFTAAALPILIRNRGGHLIYISSQGRTHARNGNVAYGASKAALTRYAANVSLENARFGIHANVVEPGFVTTSLTLASIGEEGLRAIRKDTPTKRLTTPDDVATAVSMILHSQFPLHGTVLPVCGGIQVC